MTYICKLTSSTMFSWLTSIHLFTGVCLSNTGRLFNCFKTDCSGRYSLTYDIKILFMILILTAASSGGVKESWYIMRGRSNMKINNYRAAIEAFEKAVQINPDNREAMKSLGEAYEKQGLTDKAIGQYEKYFNRFRDEAEIAFKLGDFLQWERYKYRKNDAIDYYRKGLKLKNDRRYRYKLARLLAADKENLDEAVAEYKKLLKEDPSNKKYLNEYRQLLLWDKRYLGTAIKEYQQLASQNPENYNINYQYAQLLSRDKSYNKDAIKQYEKLVKKRPQDMKLRLEYAQCLAADPARFDHAQKEFETVLSRGANNSAREKYADLLSGKSSTRDVAVKEYKKILQTNPGNTGVRLKYANLLSSKKETVPEAINQYEIVLRSQPRNGAAHKGIAGAYAWIGEKDKAVMHSELASKYGYSGALSLKRELMRGNEPYAGLNVKYINQPGDWFGLSGIAITTKGQFNPKYNITAGAELGYESFWGGDTMLHADGFLVRLNAEYRLSSMYVFNFMYGHHSLKKNGDGNEFLLKFTKNTQSGSLKAGYSRELIYESIPALAGHKIQSGSWIGTARDNRFFAELSTENRFLEGRFYPYFGWVLSKSVNPNSLVGLSADGRFKFEFKTFNSISCAYYFELRHYGKDRSGFDFLDTTPEPGGYFSPQSFVINNPRLEYSYMDDNVHEIKISTGPSFQYCRDESTDGRSVGFDIHGLYSRKMTKSFVWSTTLDYNKVSNIYSRLTINTFVRYLFDS